MDEQPVSWSLYFPLEPFSTADRKFALINELCKYLLKQEAWSVLGALVLRFSTRLVLPVDFGQLCVKSNIVQLEPAMELQPEECIGCIGCAVYEVLFETDEHSEHMERALGLLPEPSKIAIRLFNVASSLVAIPAVQSSTIGKLVTVKGTVVRLLPCRPVVTQLDFSCAKCGSVQSMTYLDGRVMHPTACTSTGCRPKGFQADQASMQTEDRQRLRLQELLSESQAAGDVGGAATLDIELSSDVVNSCKCGDVIAVTGFARVAPGDGAKFGAALSLLYIDAVSLINCSSALALESGSRPMTQVTAGAASSMPDITLKDLHFVVTFARTCAPSQFEHLVHSLCPSILGHEMVKAGIILALMGGSPAPRTSAGAKGGEAVRTRTDIHVMLLGDPGLGKSQLLRAAAAAAPRGLYLCSSTASAAGLTVACVRDAGTGEMAFEAGALVTADRGVCCLDEFDKMASEHKALLEAMEQQEVSIAKAGLTASLPARTTVIAAANPIGGVYKASKTVQENTKLSTALLSRFDLAFVLLDEADAARDEALSGHVMTLHSGRPARATPAHARILGPAAAAAASAGEAQTLRERLTHFETSNPLPVQLLRKYIAYAREFCRPRLSPAAKGVLKAFYLDVRSQTSQSRGLAVNARQLESLIRLAEARAKVDLRDVVTEQDALDAIELMQCSLRDFFQSSCSQGASKGRGRGARAQGQRLMEALRECAAADHRRQFSVAEMQQIAAGIRLQAPDIDGLIGALNESSDLLKKGGGMFAVNFA